jgi:hypothetical protein
MAWQVKYSADDSIVTVKVSGQTNLEDLVRTFAAGIAGAREHHVKRILIDARQMTITSSATQLYGLPGLLQEQGLTRAHKVAIIVSDNLEPNEDFSFLETIFYNRGFSICLYSETTQALAWLKHTAELPHKATPPTP